MEGYNLWKLYEQIFLERLRYCYIFITCDDSAANVKGLDFVTTKGLVWIPQVSLEVFQGIKRSMMESCWFETLVSEEFLAMTHKKLALRQDCQIPTLPVLAGPNPADSTISRGFGVLPKSCVFVGSTVSCVTDNGADQSVKNKTGKPVCPKLA